MSLPTPADDLAFGLTQVIGLPGLTEAAGNPLPAADIAAPAGSPLYARSRTASSRGPGATTRVAGSASRSRPPTV